MIIQSDQPCDKCKGTGYINLYSNKYKFGKKKCTFKYTFPKGILEGETITLQNFGNVNPLGNSSGCSSNGDVVMVIKYNSGNFRIDPSRNLVYAQQISIYEAITGTAFRFKHPDGRLLKFKIPAIMPGSKKIVRALGLPQLINGDLINTDLVIEFEIIYPEITEEQAKIIKSNFEEYYHDTSAASAEAETEIAFS